MGTVSVLLGTLLGAFLNEDPNYAKSWRTLVAGDEQLYRPVVNQLKKYSTHS